ncbi:helix-turn-helix domain-containing protein [Haloarcula litorea]|uniref:helix-turn-helix domain-containing protein n=1 Tax=Haloarcula litorea TaxID=3032579 RepID=UPI00300FB2A5
MGERLAEEPSIQREAIHHVEFLDDETVLTLAEGRGDRERYEGIMSSSPAVDGYVVSGDERWMAVSQFEPTDEVRRLLEWQRQADIVVETPIPFGADGAQRVTVLGEESALGEIFDEAAGIDALSVEIVETGEYDPEARRFTRSLTNRQREVLAAAVEVGYYRAPREATHADVAEAVGLSPSTVGDHLRKIEAAVFESIVR